LILGVENIVLNLKFQAISPHCSNLQFRAASCARRHAVTAASETARFMHCRRPQRQGPDPRTTHQAQAPTIPHGRLQKAASRRREGRPPTGTNGGLVVTWLPPVPVAPALGKSPRQPQHSSLVLLVRACWIHPSIACPRVG
jgi:hypothetical protein